MTWIEKDGHAFEDEETMAAYYRYRDKCKVFAALGLYIAGPGALVIFLLIGGVAQVAADVGTHVVPFDVLFAVGIFVAPAIPLGYYASRATLLHDSDKMKCYVEHNKRRRRKEDDEGPTYGPELPYPSVKI